MRQRKAGIPDLRHVADLSAFKLHDVDIVGPCGLPRRRAWTTGQMRASKHTVSADIVAFIVGNERPDRTSAVRQNCQQATAPQPLPISHAAENALVDSVSGDMISSAIGST